MRRFLSSRGAFTSLIVVVVLALVGALTTVRTASTPMRSGCVDLPDATGLLVGNAVSQFGFQIGSIDAVEPIPDHSGPNTVRAHFRVVADRQFPASVGGVTVSDSLVSQRRLELVGTPRQGQPMFNFGSCITNSKTPQSITESLDALSGLVDQFASAGGQAEFRKAIAALPQLNTALGRTGPEASQLADRLGQLMRDPGPGMSDVAAILDSFAPAASGLATNWAEIQQILRPFGANLTNGLGDLLRAGNVFAPGLTDVLLTLRSVITKYGVFAVPALQLAAPTAEIAAEQMPKVAAALRLIPPLGGALTSATGAPGTAVRVAYRGHDLQVTVKDPRALCQTVNVRLAGACTVVGDRAQVDPLVATLALTGAGK